MTRPVYERCLNPHCQREQACQSEAFCIADAEKDIWNEALETAAQNFREYDAEYLTPQEIRDSLRALKRQ